MLTVNRAVLLAALEHVARVTASHGIHPAYESVRMTLADNVLTLAGTDLESACEARIPASGNCEPLAVRCEVLRGALAACKTDDVEFSRGDHNAVVLASGAARMILQGCSPEDCAKLEAPPTSWPITLSVGDLRRFIAQTLPFSARERMRFALNGVCVRASAGTLTIAATDGRRLSVLSVPCEDSASMQVIAPRRLLDAVAQSIKGSPDEERVEIGVEGTRVWMRRGALDYSGRGIEGSFPNINEVIPTTAKHAVTLPRKALREAARRATTLRGMSDATLNFNVTPERVTLRLRSATGEYEEALDCVGSDKWETGLNVEYVREMLKAARGETVKIEATERTSPVKLVDGDWTHVLMPTAPA